MANDRPNPEPSGQFKYRLNPYFFLADRKIWVTVGILVLLLGYSLMIHVLATAAGRYAGSQWGYFAFAAPCFAVPVVVHIFAPILRKRGRRIALLRLEAGSDAWTYRASTNTWSETPPGDGDLKLLLGGLMLNELQVRSVTALVHSVAAVTTKVLEHAADVAGRDTADQRHPAVEIIVSDEVCSPYCHARLFGPVVIVFPAGITPSILPGALEEKRRVSMLLAHELSHILLRDEPISLFADVRLISISSCLQSAAVALLCATGFSVLIPASIREQPLSVPAISISSVFLAAGLLFSCLGAPTVRRAAREYSPTRGPAILAEAGVWIALFGITSAVLAFTGLTATEIADSSSRAWPLVYLTSALLVLLAHLSIYLGRRQIEFVCDEAAISALTEPARGHDAARNEMTLTLQTTYRGISEHAAHLTPVPAFAVGHSAALADLDIGSRARNLLLVIARQLETSSRTATNVRISPRFFQEVLRRTAQGLRIFESGWRSIFLPLWRTHPSLLERIAVVQRPDLQVEQDPTVPLIYTALPMITLPYLAGRLLGATTEAAYAFLVSIPILGFATLFFLVARRPMRRTTAPSQEPGAIQVGNLTFIHLGANSDTGAEATVHQTTAIILRRGVKPLLSSIAATIANRFRMWWHAPAQNSAADKNDGDWQFEIRAGGITGFVGEMYLVVRSLLIAGLLGAILLALVAPSHDGIALALPGLRLPPLQVVGAALTVAGISLAWFLAARFYSLSQWQFYEGTGFFQNLFHQSINAAKALGLALLLFGSTFGLAEISGQSVSMLAGRVGDLRGDGANLSFLASHPMFWRVTIVMTCLLLALGVAFAAVVTFWPSLPRNVLCPLGHVVPMRWRNILRRSSRDGEDAWAWLRCPSCGRPPQARHRLLCDSDAAAPTWRRSSTGVFLVLAIFILGSIGGPLWFLSHRLVALNAIGRCRSLAALLPDSKDKNAIYGDCLGKGRSKSWIPVAPDPWAPLIDAKKAAADSTPVIAGDELAGLVEERSGPIPTQTCGEWISLVRNQIASLQRCAHPPAIDPSALAGCTPDNIRNNSAWACRCLHVDRLPDREPLVSDAADFVARGDAPRRDPARERRVEETARIRSLRTLSGVKLYRAATTVLHHARDVCKSDVEKKNKGEIAWNRWHEYLELQVAPRLFFALSADLPAGTHLGATTTSRPTRDAIEFSEAVTDHCDTHLPGDLSRFMRSLIPASAIPPQVSAFDECADKREVFMNILEHWTKAQCDGAPPKSPETCEQLRPGIEKARECHKALARNAVIHAMQTFPSASAVVRDTAGPTCDTILQLEEATACGAREQCRVLSHVAKGCRDAFEHLIQCLSPAHVRRLIHEAETALVLLGAVSTRAAHTAADDSSSKNDLLTFASTIPTARSMSGIADIARGARTALARVTPKRDASQCEATEAHDQLAEWARDQPEQLIGTTPLPEAIEARLIARLQAQACERAKKLDGYQDWYAALACPELSTDHLAIRCSSTRSIRERWAPFCDPRQLDCWSLLAAPAACAADDVALEARRIRSELVELGFKAAPAATSSGDARAAQAIELEALRAELFGCAEPSRDTSNANWFVDGVACLRLRARAVSGSPASSAAVPAPIARALGLLESAPPIARMRDDLLALEKENASSVAERLRACDPFLESQRRVMLGRLATIQHRAELGAIQPLVRLARERVDRLERLIGKEDAKQLVEQFAACASSESDDLESCFRRIRRSLCMMGKTEGEASACRDAGESLSLDFGDPLNLGKCLELGRDGLMTGLQLVPETGPTFELISSCDWPRLWTESLLVAARSSRDVHREGEDRSMNITIRATDRWDLARNLAEVDAWQRAQVSGLPEFLGSNFAVVRSSWALEEAH